MSELTQDDLARLQMTVYRGDGLSCADGQNLLDTITARDTTMANLAKRYAGYIAVEACQMNTIGQLERNNLKMSEACLSVRDRATVFMRNRFQGDLDTLNHAVAQLNHLPETLCPLAFRIVQRLEDTEQQMTTLRNALAPLARLARSVHESRTKDFWFWKRSSTLPEREFGLHADDALRPELALAQEDSFPTHPSQTEHPRP